ncbi:hypothetical protein Rhal01_03628 [Rubritalea halochordaticola]|uniref:DUF2179 domain-containing protein n=1 Tax=Rubritalea halochordaticola TaxID=714537 RepID=A0ABP9V7U1_9BACT
MPESRNAKPTALKLLQFTAGLFITAWGFRAFLMENSILSGGVPGLSLLLFRLFELSPSLTQWLIGIPILVIAWPLLGKKAALASIAGSILLPAAIYIAQWLPVVPCQEPILASLFGGLIIGLGLGMIFASNFTVGGFSLVARMLNRYLGITMANSMLILDGLVIIATVFFFGPEAAMLAMLSILAISKAIDIVLTGLGLAKSITIITDKADEMREMLLEKLDSGATELPATGAYSGQNKTVFLTVIPRAKAARLRRNILRVDPQAFTIISDASEVLGYGFSHHA